MKKRFIIVLSLFTMALLLMSCSNDTDQNDAQTGESQSTEKQNNAEENHSPDKEGDKSETASESAESENNHANNGPSSESINEENNTLSAYSTDEIEFARVWLQLGENQEIDELNVKHISEGEALNPEDETSADYPEDVIQLAGARLVDGSVTYSSNEDGTINVYKIPLRWDGENPAGEDTFKEMIDHTEQVTIEPGDDEQIEELIELLHMN